MTKIFNFIGLILDFITIPFQGFEPFWGFFAICVILGVVAVVIFKYLSNQDKIKEVKNIHYMHAWNISSQEIAFSCHVVVENQQISQSQYIIKAIELKLQHSFGIDHPVLQLETEPCGEGNLLCGMPQCANRL